MLGKCLVTQVASIWVDTAAFCAADWVCTRLCLVRLPECVNRLLQTLHSNGHAPEWTRLCMARWWLSGQYLPHSLQRHFSWTLTCLRKIFSAEKPLWHIEHEYVLSPCPCAAWWQDNWHLVPNCLLHAEQWYTLFDLFWCFKLYDRW